MKLRVQLLICIIILECLLQPPSCQVFAFFVCLASSCSAARPRVISSSFHRSPMMEGNSNDDDEEESSSEDEDSLEKKRMENVRRLQKTFYQTKTNNDRGATSNGDGDDNDDEPQPRLEEESGIVMNLPLWRVSWVETPGRSNCLNVHEGQYTNMFEKILSGPEPWYVGHLHLPGGFKMTRTQPHQPRFDLKTWRDELNDELRFEETERSAVVGCLMRITDYRRTVDGRLILLVHAMERFVIDSVVQHFPYSIAHCQILPDSEGMMVGGDGGAADENFTKRSRANAVVHSFQYHDYEYDKIQLPLPDNVEYLPPEGIPVEDIAKVLPFAYYSSDDTSLDNIQEVPRVSSAGFLGGDPPLEQMLKNGGILRDPVFIPGPQSENRRTTDIDVLETLLWLALDDFCRHTGFVLPEEIGCLLPRGLDYLDMDSTTHRLSNKYPIRRRQRRLSYLAPVLLENFEIGATPRTPVEMGAGMRQNWLNTPSTQARLGAVLERYELINHSLMMRQKPRPPPIGEFE